MISNLLSLEGVEAEVFGEHLQGGIGELAATGVVRVMVADDDYPQAHQVVAEWEAKQSVDTAQSDYEVSNRSSSIGSLLIGFVLGGVVVLAILNTPISNYSVDYDSDGILDENWFYSSTGLLRRFEHDRNDDGSADMVYRYNLEGLIKSASYDENFDGIFEGRSNYHYGNVMWHHSDNDSDGFDEYHENYRFGILVSKEFLNPESEKVKKRLFYNNGILVKGEVDTNDDGVMDTTYEFDQYEQIIKEYPKQK